MDPVEKLTKQLTTKMNEALESVEKLQKRGMEAIEKFSPHEKRAVIINGKEVIMNRTDKGMVFFNFHSSAEEKLFYDSFGK